ncbi:MAG: hypothetical protein QNL04_10435 [SAR324 cluster bacterium]|nr:hypothetical protein [SAR324 cluster bacterium]
MKKKSNFEQSKNKEDYWNRMLLALAAIFLVGVFISLILALISFMASNSGDYLDYLSFWAWRIVTGIFINEVAVLVFLSCGWIPVEKSLRGFLPLMVVSTCLVSIFFIWLLADKNPLLIQKVIFFIKVSGISFVINGMLYRFSPAYDVLCEVQGQSLFNSSGELTLSFGYGESAFWVPVHALSCVVAEGAELKVTFQNNGVWETKKILGKVKDVQVQAHKDLLKLGRILLVNPDWVQNITQQSEGLLINLAGLDEPQVAPNSVAKKLQERVKAG